MCRLLFSTVQMTEGKGLERGGWRQGGGFKLYYGKV
jgi:hypothetical protein